MARQGYDTNPAQKHVEVFYDFSGGMNTVTTNESMADKEAMKLINVNLVERGPVERRFGMVSHLNQGVGKGQGYFRFYHDEDTYDEITASGGNLYKNGVLLPITGLPSGFQTVKTIEAVQFMNALWIATGTKLVEFDGTTAKVVDAYKPLPLDALYIGTNGLADDPNNYLSDGEAISMRIDGVTFSSRYGIANQPVTLTAYTSKPANKLVEFLWEWRPTFLEEGKWYTGQDWSSNKVYVFSTPTEGDVQFRVSLREKGLTVAETQYLVPKYKIKPTTDPKDVPVDSQYIHRCNRILLHWNRLYMYGDITQPDAVYISHLNNPRYFPVPNSLRFENGRNERLTVIKSYRDMLIAWTPTTIQALYGKSPLDYRRVTLNTSIGCIAPDTAQVFRNYIYFLSYDGVYLLKSVGYTEDKANVEKVDTNIANMITPSEDACAISHDGQYQIVFPQTNKRFRFYVDKMAWVMDESPKLDFHRMFVIDNVMFGQSINNSQVMKFDRSVFNDDGHIYTDTIETKGFNFGQPYHHKKLKQVQIMTSPRNGTIDATVTIYADEGAILNPDQSFAQVNPTTGEVEWVPYFETNFSSGAVFGAWVMGESPFGNVTTSIAKLPISGKCYTTRMKFEHTEDLPSVFLGLAYIFKLKKPK